MSPFDHDDSQRASETSQNIGQGQTQSQFESEDHPSPRQCHLHEDNLLFVAIGLSLL